MTDCILCGDPIRPAKTLTARIPAGDDTAFAPGAFDGQIGKVITVHAGDRNIEGILRAAQIADDGRAVVVTVDLPGGGS